MVEVAARGSAPRVGAFAPMQRLLDALDGVAWIVDTEGTILACGAPNWRRFAAANGGAEIVDPAAVVGRSLASFIAGDEVRMLYRRVIDEIRFGAQEALVLPSSCGAPAVAREMRMSVTPIRAGGGMDGILFQSVTLSETDRPPVNLYDFAHLLALYERDRALPILVMCSLCQRVRHPVGGDAATGEWIAAEEHYRRGGSAQVRISHTVCRSCHGAVRLGDRPIG